MDRVEQLVDEVIEAYRAKRIRLWLANFTDLPDLFGEWGGVVRITAEDYVGRWTPGRDGLLDRARRRFSEGTEASFDVVAEELVPIAREGFARDLTARQVPPKIAERAKEVLLPHPPKQQWKM